MRHRGFVKSYDQGARFGFIESSDGQEIFVHHTGVSGRCCLVPGMEVEFECREPGRATGVTELQRAKAAGA